MKKELIFKYAAIVTICVVLDIGLHVMTRAYSTIPENADFTQWSQFFGVEIVATLWALLAFSGVAWVFHRFQHSIPGRGIIKGTRYGAGIALLWMAGMLEGISLFGNSAVNESVVGLSDAVPVLIMGVLLGWQVTGKGHSNPEMQQTLQRKWMVIAVFSAVFVFGRSLAYLTGTIQSGIHTRPVLTILWTILMGACIGMVYLLAYQAASHSSRVLDAVRFGCWIFGVNWMVFLVFMPLLFHGYFADFLARAGIDIMLVTAGTYLSLSLLEKARDESRKRTILHQLPQTSATAAKMIE